jgi:hypothetical protein
LLKIFPRLHGIDSVLSALLRLIDRARGAAGLPVPNP